MQCHDPKECNRRLRKLIYKVNCEIVKVDEFFETCNNSGNSLICHNPSRDEKKRIINAIKANSSASCMLIEELKMHRTEVKYLMNAFSKLMEKHEKIKILRKKQEAEVEKLYCCMKTDLLPITNKCKKEKPSVDWKKIQVQENCELERTFEKLVTQFTTVAKDCEDLCKHIANRPKDVADEKERDEMLFCLAIRDIQKAFCIRAELGSKEVDFLDYCFPNASQCDDNFQSDDDSQCHCDTDTSEYCCCSTD